MRSTFGNTAVAIASAVAGWGVIAFADPANASLPERAPAVVVSVADLNLDAPAGRATAARRIRTAADRVCRFDGDRIGPSGRCRAAAIADAERRLDALAAR